MYMDSIKYSNKDGELKTTGDRRMANVWSMVHAFIIFLVGTEYIEKDIMEHSERPKIRNEAQRVFMEQDEIQIVMDAAKQAMHKAKRYAGYEGWEARDYLALRMLIETGMRVTALTEINVEDLDFESRTVQVVDKRGKIHNHPLSKETAMLASEWIECKEVIEWAADIQDNDALFISKINKSRLSAESVNDIIKKHTVDLGKHITAHKFRGTYATTLYRETGDIYFVKECMGHSNVATTQIYVEPKSNNKEKALEIMSKIMNS